MSIKFTFEEQAEINSLYCGDLDWDDIPKALYEKLYDLFFNDMPLTTANGDEGTFDDWIQDRLPDILAPYTTLEGK